MTEMKSEKVLFFNKIFHRSLQDNTVLSQCRGRPNGGGKGTAEAPGSILRTKSGE